MIQEWKFDVGGMTLRGKRWGVHGGRPVLALHGWLDNSASFDFLAPKLRNVDFLALDLAGQGKSDHRPGLGAYNIWSDLQEILGVVDQLGWKQFAVVGHSRGAMIATLLAGTFPLRITHLACIESFAPQTLEADEAPKQLAAAIEGLLNLRGKNRSSFATFEDAVKAREQGFLKLCHADALALACRGVDNIDGRFVWRNDIKLNAPSELKFTPEQAWAFVKRIAVPIQVIVAERGLVHEFPHMKPFYENNPNVQVTQFEGEHHLHMSHQCEAIADVLNAYFSV